MHSHSKHSMKLFTIDVCNALYITLLCDGLLGLKISPEYLEITPITLRKAYSAHVLSV